MMPVDPGLIAGTAGICGAFLCYMMFRRQRSSAKADRETLRAELESIMHAQQVECLDQIAQFAETVAILGRSAQHMDDASKGGLTRSIRSQAMQLLRSG